MLINEGNFLAQVHRKTFSLICLSLIAFVSSCGNILATPEAVELRVAYEEFQKVSLNADLTLDATKLSKVATGKTLEMALASIERKKGFAMLVSAETSISNFAVLQYQENRAIIKANVYFQNFTQDQITGKRNYYSESLSIVQVEMLRENGRWKVSQIESRNWDN